MKKFFLSTGFQWPTPELFDKIGAAHPWSGTEKTSDPPPKQPKPVTLMWIGTLGNIGLTLTTFTANCQLCHCQQSQKAIQKRNP